MHGVQVLQAGLQAGLELKAGLAGRSLGRVLVDEICHQLRVGLGDVEHMLPLGELGDFRVHSRSCRPPGEML